MQERVHQAAAQRRSQNRDAARTPDRPTICTFHSLCVRILRQHIEKLGYKRNFVIYDESEQLGAVKKILAPDFRQRRKDRPGRHSQPAQPLPETAANAPPSLPIDSVRAMAEHIRTRYESALRACNAVDFDDLILLTLRLFNEHPDALEACRAKYRYVMVDEYQDTNAAQFQLVHALTQEHRNLCVVGDDDQSIYGWRGAEIANLLDMEKHFPRSKSSSSNKITAPPPPFFSAANAVIKNNVRRRGKQLWSQKGDGRENRAAHLCRRRGGGPHRRRGNRIRPPGAAACRGATRRSSFAPTSSRARWKPPCARPACAII